jgi:hypothetical protein
MAILLRYTNLAATIHLLRKRVVTLLDPSTWDDKNDSYFMSQYRELKKVDTLLALCFAECEQTYHHWRVFSYGTDGVCIEFNKSALLNAFSGDHNIRTGSMNYQNRSALSSMPHIPLAQIPFLKRQQYEPEMEFRIIYEESGVHRMSVEYHIELSCINRITLSPWIPRSLAYAVKGILLEIKGCSKTKIVRSTLVENEQWKNLSLKIKP